MRLRWLIQRTASSKPPGRRIGKHVKFRPEDDT